MSPELPSWLSHASCHGEELYSMSFRCPTWTASTVSSSYQFTAFNCPAIQTQCCRLNTLVWVHRYVPPWRSGSTEFRAKLVRAGSSGAIRCTHNVARHSARQCDRQLRIVSNAQQNMLLAPDNFLILLHRFPPELHVSELIVRRPVADSFQWLEQETSLD